MVSEDSRTFDRVFPADCPHLQIVTAARHNARRVLRDTRGSQQIARFVLGTTVVMPIVTAAIDRGFGSGLITPPLDLPASGRRHPLYVRFRVSRELCFW